MDKSNYSNKERVKDSNDYILSQQSDVYKNILTYNNSEQVESENYTSSNLINKSRQDKEVNEPEKKYSFSPQKRKQSHNKGTLIKHSELEPIYENTENFYSERKVSPGSEEKNNYYYDEADERREHWESNMLKKEVLPNERFNIKTLNNNKSSVKELRSIKKNRRSSKASFIDIKGDSPLKNQKSLNMEEAVVKSNLNNYTQQTGDDNKSVSSRLTSNTNIALLNKNAISSNNLISKPPAVSNTGLSTISIPPKRVIPFSFKSESVTKNFKTALINEYKQKFQFNYRIFFYCLFFIVVFSIFYIVSEGLASQSKTTLNLFLILNYMRTDMLDYINKATDLIIKEGFNGKVRTAEKMKNNFEEIKDSFTKATKSMENMTNFFREHYSEVNDLVQYMNFLNNNSLCNEYAISNSLITEAIQNNDYSVIDTNINPDYNDTYAELNVNSAENKMVFTKPVFTDQIELYPFHKEYTSTESNSNDNCYSEYFNNFNSIKDKVTGNNSLPQNFYKYKIISQNVTYINVTQYSSYYAFCNSSFYREGLTQGLVQGIDFIWNIDNKIPEIELSTLKEKIQFLINIDIENYLLLVEEIYLPIMNLIIKEYSESNASEKLSLIFLMSKVKLSIVLSLCFVLLLLYYKANLEFTQILVFNRSIMLLIPSSAYKKKEQYFGLFMDSLD
eukprot:CAMPEP_0170521680 /NCGR_PEP_ID=MMETSP0209-20121228/7041_1 /TAXON_ID=665100 ORGANISM="Litonotus pictus, Strain P1" /NCGR_SAMPLE_ID=MMETSP0209 /ASSEMBLY_ACC=CAM_ASM_000301 /LENGTH=674 /DNA_ID=CAMNT_0010808679 /DNA_START=958 /DNA_END=2982 /DNA_ORIENTATION=+